MNIYETLKKNRVLVCAVAIALIWFVFGFWVAKHHYNKPFEEKVERDTLIIHDTIPDYQPAPIDSVRVKWVTRWLPSKIDTITQWETLTVRDSVAVEVPITSKHFGGKNYDAYVSGFEPNLDSIFVYSETQYITETITRMKPPNKFELDVVGGIDYNITTQKYMPHVGGEFIYKPSRFQLGLRGGVVKNDKIEPFVGLDAKIRLF